MELPVENLQGRQLSINAPPHFDGIDCCVDREACTESAHPQRQQHRQSGPTEGDHLAILPRSPGKSGAIIAGRPGGLRRCLGLVPALVTGDFLVTVGRS